MLMTIMAPVAGAHPDGSIDDGTLHRDSISSALESHDASTEGIVSTGPTGKKIKNLDLVGSGDRLDANATTDVWALGNYAYTGTFGSPCGGDPSGEAGIWVWDVHNKNNPTFVGVIESEAGDRTNDVRVSSMNSGDILVMSNESCGGGNGGFEIWDVDDPENPVKLASVVIDESDLNTISPLFFAPGALDEVGVHNLWLFTQGDRDYVSAVSEGAFDNFRIYDITDPTSPVLMSGWGAEELVPGLPVGVSDYSDLVLGDTDPTGSITLNALLDLFSGFGSSQNKFLHDVTISADGTMAYLANWDAGLVLLDISDVTDPQLVSVAIDPVNGSLDGEVNSHAVWPNEDGSIVVEGEEDFDETDIALTIGGDELKLAEMSNNDTSVASVIPLSGEVVFVGQGCDTFDYMVPGIDEPPFFEDPYLADATGKIAVIRRGGCSFFSKVMRAAEEGAIAAIIADNTPGGTAAPGSFTANGATGGIPAMTMSTVDGDLIESLGSAEGTLGLTFESWAGLRIWDYSDPANPRLASTFNTVCSADAGDPSCDPAGTYSVHNLQVETRGNKTFAYVSWYSDGMLVLDVSDPDNPVEVARFFDNSQEFIEANGGQPHDYWGVYKLENSPYIFGSDRNGGLDIFKEKGSGSGGGSNKKP